MIAIVGNNPGDIDIAKIVSMHFADIKNYGKEHGWPVHVGILRNEKNDVFLFDLRQTTKLNYIICDCKVAPEHKVNDVVSALSSNINFLV